MNRYSYLILRLSVGFSMLGHGLVRISKLAAFSEGMVKNFANSILPSSLVSAFSHTLPFAEFMTGLLLVIGLFTKQAAMLGAFIMICLIIGTTLIEQWDSLPSQLIHAAFFSILIQFLPSNRYAVDNLIQKNL